ncbi:hypothetical protein [Mucilaginibacter sp. SG564]|uniref:hypothetical protein n=1 Tax=Mucilaginibacter sp. SG564 TaxID=2587022 RepID=UPI001C12C500|nr:hypothetical protein [Mucilaginibacter sp. SG564]NOW98950.1 hypothetical protein [Mucilaginibacter sp. SG564]
MKLSSVKMIQALMLCGFISTAAWSQEVKKETKVFETKMDKFSSKTGTISKFVDFRLPDLKTGYTNAETRIRKLMSGTESLYFYQIEKKGQYSNTTASIEYSDLLEVIKALKTLTQDVEKDIAGNPDYLENKFVTTDGFQLGYYVEKGRSTWYVKLEKYGTDNTLFIKDRTVIESAFGEARAKIEDLRK